MTGQHEKRARTGYLGHCSKGSQDRIMGTTRTGQESENDSKVRTVGRVGELETRMWNRTVGTEQQQRKVDSGQLGQEREDRTATIRQREQDS